MGLLFTLAGFYTFITILLPTPTGFQPGLVSLIAVAALGWGLVAMVLPWARIPGLLRLAVAPAAMALIALHNMAAGQDAFRYGMFFFLVFIWLGLCEPRGTSLRMSPFLLAAYLGPLWADGRSAADLASISYALPIYLTVGEVLAWRTQLMQRLQGRLRRLADHDPLTGLPNRAVFTAALREHCAKPESVAVLFLDLDGFKQINDRLGHAAGDDVLVQVGATLRAHTRPGYADLPCRLAGDEFVLLLSDTDLAAARSLAEQLEQRLGELRAADGTPVRGSVGVAGGVSMDAQQLLATADEAMYAAKQAKPVGRRAA
ncbi:GGDEF domain-containing protein [Actinoplanes sp. NEAU-A11]|uniref:GGDEF domain-containing protein n=2 Tax=Actinoplanes aureus TaxID=2792083 RepID=A0A931G038_9ACTN|nr:GGDEF domain-containing protein [Actinoplanes aureus]